MDNFSIRPADVNDVLLLAEMDRICFSVPWSEHSFYEEIIENKLARYIVAESEKNIIGYAGIWIILDEGHITNVSVHPDFRRKGVARAMLSKLLESSRAEGADVFTLEVRVSNNEAVSLYRSLGFKKEGIRKRYYEDNNEDAIIMWKKSYEK